MRKLDYPGFVAFKKALLAPIVTAEPRTNVQPRTRLTASDGPADVTDIHLQVQHPSATLSDEAGVIRVAQLDVDLHTHHVRCGHALGDLEDYVRHALEIGIRILGISDHAPLFAHEDDHPAPRIQMARSEFPRYLEEARRLQRAYAGAIQVLVGVEADYIPGSEDVYRDALAREELDFVIGSVHAFGPHHVYQRETWAAGTDRAELFRSYFRHVQGAARSGMFDVLAHFDAIKVFGPEVFEVAPRELEQTIDAIVESGITVEINTAGLRKCGEVFPRPSLIGELAGRGVPFTFGSDAHAPGELLHGGRHVLELCAAHGIDAFHYFVRRRRHRYAIAPPA